MDGLRDFFARFRVWIVALLGTAAVATPLALTQGSGKVDVFVGSTPTPVATVTCSGVNVTTATISARLSAAAAGDVLCLSAGTYSSFPKKDSSSPGITITPASGVARTDVQVSYSWNSTSTTDWLIFDGVAVNSSTVSAPTTNVTWRNVDFQSNLNIDPSGGIYCGPCPAMSNANIVIEDSVFSETDCPDTSCQLNHGRLTIIGDPGGSTLAGIIVRDNTFAGGALCGDGIQLAGFTSGVTITGNTFEGLDQQACDAITSGPHIDPIQGVDSRNITIEDNLLLNNSTGIVSYDGDAIDWVVRNNVIEADGDAVCIGGMAPGIVEHNTIIDGNIILCESHQGDQSLLVTWRNNIMAHNFDRIEGTSSFAAGLPNYDWCITETCAGANSLNSTPAPSWVGGASPTTFAGYALVASSRGTNVASDGQDIGIDLDLVGD